MNDTAGTQPGAEGLLPPDDSAWRPRVRLALITGSAKVLWWLTDWRMAKRPHTSIPTNWHPARPPPSARCRNEAAWESRWQEVDEQRIDAMFCYAYRLSYPQRGPADCDRNLRNGEERSGVFKIVTLFIALCAGCPGTVIAGDGGETG